MNRWRCSLLPLQLSASVLVYTAVAAGPLAAQGDSTGLSARAIVHAAIVRRRALVATFPAYQYQVAVKLLVHDLDQPQDSPSSVVMIRETRSSASWQAPRHYREIIVARRQASHLNAVWNALSIAEIGNFQRGRIEVGSHRLVSPIAADALDHYRFRIEDTLSVDGRPVIRLAIVPRSETSPGFTGVIDIAAENYDVLAMDVGVNDATRFGIWRNVRYQVRFEDSGLGGLMPREIRLTGEARLSARLPRTPRDVGFEQNAQLADFRFASVQPAGDLREVRVMVDRQADHPDSAAWSVAGAMPSTTAERRIWSHRDSAARQLPRRLGRLGQAIRLSQFTTASQDFFHFNRVDGLYAGAGSTWRKTPDLTLGAKLGRGSSDRWQYRFGGEVQVSRGRRFWLGAWYHDETVTRPGLITHQVDRTVDALLFRRDPLDYYRERGLTLSLAIRPLDFTRLELRYSDQEQSILPVVTDYSVLTPSRAPRANGFIVSGRMRSLFGSLTYDSRSLIRRNGLDSPLQRLTWTRVNLSAEVASPGLIPGDFRFGRYSLQIERHQQTLGLGLTTINALVGVSTGTLPPQRYFTIDFGMRRLGFQGGGLRTVGDTGFAGNRMAMLSIRHDFGRLLFVKSGLPLIRRLPFTLNVYGAAFAIDFVDHAPYPGDGAFRNTSGPYTEAGFGLGNLLPFLAPLDLGVQLTWQLSKQSTRRFQFGLSLTRP